MQAQAAAAASDPPCSDFDIKNMRGVGWQADVLNWALQYPQSQCVMGFLRRFAPIWRIPFAGWFFISRYDDVREVLSHDADFPVLWNKKMVEMTRGPNFVLGMADGPEYRRNYRQIAAGFRREDVAKIVVPRSAEISEELLARSHGRIDAMQDLITDVPTRLCKDYVGIDIPDTVLFAQWTVAISGYLFGPPNDDSNRMLGRAAASCLRSAIQVSVQGGATGTVVPRLLENQSTDPELNGELIRAHLFGMIVGFIPTNLIAGGNILETLLRFPDFMERARAAAMADDDELLWRCLQEALRFRFLNPGAWRTCRDQGYTLAAGTERETRIPGGATLMVSMQSAMFDERSVQLPHEFNPGRRPEEYLVFGYGQHWCIGAYIAMAQITQTFKALLKRKRLRPAAGNAGRMKRIAVYPMHLTLEFDP